ncbi:MAG: hypothetical protein JW797_00695 [Bradymonadales bacterium]|nr:hypothetical protein [Bradymonadales bacterium]
MSATRRFGPILLLLLLAPAARAQWLPPAQWEEPTVIDPSHPSVTATERTGGEAAAIPAQDYPQPMYQHEVEALAERTAGAILPVRATFRRDPMLFPETIEILGAATATVGPDGETVWITSLSLVEGASQVVFDLPRGPVDAAVISDARFGLALLEPVGTSLPATSPLNLSGADAGCREEAITANRSQVGATMGAGEAQYGFYQVNTLGVILGYPLVDRDGEILGIGSHYYPVNPVFSLAVPAAAVREFLARQADD